MYLGLYHLPRICCTLVHEIHVHPEILCVFQYIDVLMCVICKPGNGATQWRRYYLRQHCTAKGLIYSQRLT